MEHVPAEFESLLRRCEPTRVGLFFYFFFQNQDDTVGRSVLCAQRTRRCAWAIIKPGRELRRRVGFEKYSNAFQMYRTILVFRPTFELQTPEDAYVLFTVRVRPLTSILL